MPHRKVIILGSGPAGLTAAVYTGRANLKPLLIHGPAPHGQLSWTTEVENYPGFPKGVLGPELMDLMEEQAKRFGTEFVEETVTAVALSQKPLSVTTAKETYTCDALIIATGATPKYLNIPGEKELSGYGVSTCATCDGAFFRDQIIAVAGGGDSACEEALFLSRFGSKVLLIHRREELRASKIMQDRVFANKKIEPVWNSILTGVVGEKQTGVKSLTIKNSITGEESSIEANALFVAIGHVPNSSLFKGLLDMDENGYIEPTPNSTKTKLEGVFACGDVQDHIFRQAITAAGTGCMAAIEAERYLEGVGQ